jgi:FAD/FMN-containing dehydrogenase
MLVSGNVDQGALALRKTGDFDLIVAITSVVGNGGLQSGDDIKARQVSWVGHAGAAARALVRPSSTQQLSEVMRLCFEARQPVVPLGGNTGLVDGALATGTEIFLSLERMNAIEAIDTAGCTMTVQAGVPLQVVQERAAEAGLLFALDLGGRGTATIGGNISTNAGGNQVIRFGMMREQVLGLEAVLADGTVLSSMNRMLKNNAGYDLKQLFIGTEGTLGIVTRAVLRLRPAPRSQCTAFVAADSFAVISRLLRELESKLGGTLNAFEVMWEDFYETILAASNRHTSPVERGHPFYALIEARGGDQAKDGSRFEQVLGEALEQGIIADAAIAGSHAQREALWAIRDDIDNLMKALAPMIVFDVSLPILDMPAYVDRVKLGLAKEFAGTAKCATFGHVGDGNVHFCISVGSGRHELQRKTMDIVYRELEPIGGSISAEHGIGLEKRPFLHYSRNPAELALMKTLKNALDPRGLLNPGKVIG